LYFTSEKREKSPISGSASTSASEYIKIRLHLVILYKGCFSLFASTQHHCTQTTAKQPSMWCWQRCCQVLANSLSAPKTGSFVLIIPKNVRIQAFVMIENQLYRFRKEREFLQLSVFVENSSHIGAKRSFLAENES